jgi:PTH1 family peptidyl-tRNA hydrolase
MWLIVGLGNPGAKYEQTRHNVGFAVIERLADRGRTSFNSQFKGEVAKVDVGGERCILVKPQTFMNLSGDSVQPAAAFFKIAPANIIVVHDEVDLDLGQLKLKKGGGHGGHNGIRHISERLGPEFFRVRLGIGRPKFGKSGMTSHVLGGFAADEADGIEAGIERAADAVELIIREGLVAAQNKFHEKKKKKKKEKKQPAETVEATDK